jgi:hypothetical protein
VPTDSSLSTDLRTISARLAVLARTLRDVGGPAVPPEPALVACMLQLACIGALLADAVEHLQSTHTDGHPLLMDEVRQWLDLVNLAVWLADPSPDLGQQ